MGNKLSKLAMVTMPRVCVTAVVAALSLSGCNSSSNSGTTPPVEDVVKAQDLQAVIYVMSDTKTRAAADMTLHVWNNDQCKALDGDKIDGFQNWDKGVQASGSDDNGYYWILPLVSETADDCVNFIVRDGEGQSDDLKLEFAKITDRQGFVTSDYAAILDNADDTIPVEMKGASASWVDEDTLLWDAAKNAAKVELYHSATADIKFNSDEQTIEGGEAVELSDGSATDAVKTKFPHLKDWAAFEIAGDRATKQAYLKGQLIAVARDADGKVKAVTKVQIPGVLDALYTGGEDEAKNADKETLGVTLDGGSVTFGVWAPTSQSVELLVYSAADDSKLKKTYPMVDADGDGVYKLIADDVEVGDYYRYRVKVYHPVSDKIETFETTDPYGQSFSSNSRFTQVADMNDPALMPDGWNDYKFAAKDEKGAKPMDAVLYEAHIRDFSINDTKGSPELNGKYMAFTEEDRDSVKHLQSMVDAGLTYFHLMPTFDIGTVDEDPAKRANLNSTVAELCKLNATAGVCNSADQSKTLKALLESYDPETEDAQALMNDLREFDAFNWGYDPYHYNAPEGSTSTDAEGTTRIKEFREMVQALHDMGLKVVMDMVYNHTNASGLNDQSVLDKLVPGYYHRLNEITGAVERSTCCDNTATENTMMEKVMIDSLEMWTKDYKVDSYRFDLAGFHMKSNMIKAREAVEKINPSTYFYMEAWDYGETVNNRRGVNGSQWNMGGTGYGTFSDRLRDSVRGTVYSDSGETMKTRKGFGNAGVAFDDADQVVELNRLTDLVRLGMAANLKNYIIEDQNGVTKRGQDIDYGGQHAGYAENPQETINYISKHDNQTLWDINQYKIAKDVSLADRVRMQNVANSTVLLGQGVPFFQLGVSLLRSKSMQRDSYNSGDWYNKVDFDLDNPELTNNWNVGLPRKDKDEANYPYILEAIKNVQTQPHAEEVLLADKQFKELMEIRTGSQLFHLDTAKQVNSRIDFHNTGKDQKAGVIVMSIDDGAGLDDLDPNFDAAVIVVNASTHEQTMPIEGATGFTLHQIQQDSVDDVVLGASFASGEFTVPALTTAVFVKKQAGAQGTGLPVAKKDTSNIPTFGDSALFVRGLNDNWDAATAMKFSNYAYSVDLIVDAGVQTFKVADADWSDETNFDMSKIKVGTDSVALAAADGNISFTADAKAIYNFKVNAADDQSNPTVTVTFVKAIADSVCEKMPDSSDAAPLGDTSLFVRGSHSDWSADPAYQLSYKGDNIYQAYFAMTKADKIQFKIADDTDNWGVQYSVKEDGKFINLLDGMEYTAVKQDAGSSNNTADLAAATYSVKFTLNADDKDQAMLKIEKCD